MPSHPSLTFADIFTGGGGATIGAQLAGLRPIFGLERDADIAHHANLNFEHITHCTDLLDYHPRYIPSTHVFHASPPCPNFSQAKNGAKETEADLALAHRIADIIFVNRPYIFTLENVRAYRKSQSFKVITDMLTSIGYKWDANIYDAADYGVPQHRKRLILRSVISGELPPPPEKLPRQVGWYEAIQDLIPSFKKSQLAQWQLKRLGMLDQANDLLIAGGNQWTPIVPVGDPAYTITKSQADHPNRVRLVQGGSASRTILAPGPNEPAFTIKANDGYKQPAKIEFMVAQDARDGIQVRAKDEPAFTIKVHSRKPRISIEAGVYELNMRALARLQTFPDAYILPDERKLAATIIGNALPPTLYAAILRSLLA